MSVYLSVCRQSRTREACMKAVKPINVKIYDGVKTMITECSIMTSPQIQDGGRPLI